MKLIKKKKKLQKKRILCFNNAFKLQIIYLVRFSFINFVITYYKKVTVKQSRYKQI